MNAAQKLLLETYACGDYSNWTDADFEAAEGTGDGLVSFLFRELSDAQDCPTLDDADNRMVTVLEEVEDVYRVIHHAFLTSLENT